MLHQYRYAEAAEWFKRDNKGIEEYLKLPYTKVIHEVIDKSVHYFYGRILELYGCQSTGDSLEELNHSLNEAMRGYLETKLELGLPIPRPFNADTFSGKFVVRLPKTLHQHLSMKAKREWVSLNQLVLCNWMMPVVKPLQKIPDVACNNEISFDSSCCCALYRVLGILPLHFRCL